MPTQNKNNQFLKSLVSLKWLLIDKFKKKVVN